MAKTMTQLIPEYLDFREHRQHMAANTLKVDKTTMHTVLIAFGDIQPAHVTQRHIDNFIALISQGGPSKYNQRLTGLRSFFQFCRDRRYVPVGFNPLAGERTKPVERLERSRVPVGKFGVLLDVTPTPYERIIVALGLYLFLRASEMITLRIGDINLDDGEIRVVVHKKRGGHKVDFMPISTELDRELRAYLTWYAEKLGVPLEADFHLIPRRWTVYDTQRGCKGRFSSATRSESMCLRPYQPITAPHRYVKNALAAIGYETVRQEGVHTLRRSGARALFDTLVDKGYDGALRHVQAMLHHEGIEMTERYIGLREDRYRRDQVIRGKTMFPTGENVVELRRREAAWASP